MKYLFTNLYTGFECIGSNCPDSCCKDWVIEIDRDTYWSYDKLEEPLRTQICENIIEENGKYRIKLNDEGRCPFWNENQLCDICINLSQEYLGYVCDNYPRRFTTCLETVSVTLMLSCPIAARKLLGYDKPLQISVIDDGNKLEDKGFNWRKYNMIVNGLEANVSILQESNISLRSKIMALLDLNSFIDDNANEVIEYEKCIKHIKELQINWEKNDRYFSEIYAGENIEGTWGFVYDIFEILSSIQFNDDRKNFINKYKAIKREDEEQYRLLKTELKRIQSEIQRENVITNYIFGHYLDGFSGKSCLKLTLKAVLFLATIDLMAIVAIKEHELNSEEDYILKVSKTAKLFENATVFDELINQIIESNSKEKMWQMVYLV